MAPTKATMAVTQPDVKTFVGPGLFDDQIRCAVLVYIHSGYRQRCLIRFERECRVGAAREVKFNSEAVLARGCRARLDKKSTIRLMIVIEIRDRQTLYEQRVRMQRRAENYARQHALNPVLSPQAWSHENQKGCDSQRNQCARLHLPKI